MIHNDILSIGTELRCANSLPPYVDAQNPTKPNHPQGLSKKPLMAFTMGDTLHMESIT